MGCIVSRSSELVAAEDLLETMTFSKFVKRTRK